MTYGLASPSLSLSVGNYGSVIAACSEKKEKTKMKVFLKHVLVEYAMQKKQKLFCGKLWYALYAKLGDAFVALI